MKKTSIGGQALIEGIMMRGPGKMATAVRKTDGEIVTKVEDLDVAKRAKIKKQMESRLEWIQKLKKELYWEKK